MVGTRIAYYVKRGMGKVSIQDRSDLARNIVSKRGEKGWSQEDLADKVGIHVNIIKKIETDKGEGEFATRKAIADALGCTISELYISPDRQPSSPLELFGSIVKIAAAFNHDQLKSAFEFIVSIAEIGVTPGVAAKKTKRAR